MNPHALKQWVALLALIFTAPANAQNNVVLTLNPISNMPEVVSEPGLSQPIHFTSINYDPAGDPTPFTLTFGADFVGNYIPEASDPAVENGWTVVFSSTYRATCPGAGGPMPCEEVIIKLTSPAANHPPSGYKYDVEMGGQLLDPRIRGR